ncbi:MAG: hypothetical protein E7388_06980 [Ruminococcaceae bacterium]|nr:hypothetical protein [Oscillospiraceae bacterium]
MCKIFLCTDSYALRTLHCSLDYVLNVKVKEIIVLKENYKKDEVCKRRSDIKITVYDTIYECILNSEWTIIVSNSNIPAKTIDYIKQVSHNMKKGYYFIENPWNLESELNDRLIFSIKGSEVSTLPIIAQVSLGILSQPYFTEIALNKKFSKENIKVRQIFTDETNRLLNELNKCELLNGSLSNQIDNRVKNFDILCYSINVGNDIYSIKNYIHLFSNLKPDYLILQTDFRFNNYDLANQIVKYWCFSDLDIILKSHYTLSDQKYKLYCDEQLSLKENVLDIESAEVEENLFRSIFNKLSLPKGIFRIS